MIIIGIDPNPEKSAYVVWDSKLETILEMDILENYLILNNEIIKASMFNGPRLLAIEVPLIFGGKVWQQVIDTAFIAGLIAGRSNLPFRMIAPNEWKLHIAGKRGANDQLIKQALMSRFGPKGTKKSPGKLYGLKSHLWDAFGVAVCAGDTIKTESVSYQYRG